ncbi:unnamed protein product [Gongylonema pulchrum]|uniref:Sepiapterin reductase n=1 Tax=Gongylonema pulchrum TaxID=637853 RepID=A0A183CVZ5_9BILA|nr:unnamed protein product [Gongylonema pulchrum]
MERYGANPEADYKILKVNGLGAAEFLSIVLPAMEAYGGGQIVVMSSSLGYRPLPYVASYCASKAMLLFLCESISREYPKIHVQCLTPALVATNMTHYDKTHGSLFVKTPDSFACEAVNTIGLVNVTTGCFNHEFQMLLRHLFPWCMLKYILLPFNWYHKHRTDQLHKARVAADCDKKVLLFADFILPVN